MLREWRRHFSEAIDDYLRHVRSLTEYSITSGWNEAAECIEPLYNILVSPNQVVVTVDLPYVDPNKLKVKVVADDVIEVEAFTKRKITFHDLGLKHRKGQFSCYHARIHVPVPVVESGISHVLKKGMVEIRLPRAF